MIPAAATGIGSMPGTSVAEAMAVVAGEVPEWPFLPELPARGAGADMIGRTAAVLVSVAGDFAMDAVPTGWRRTGVVGPEIRRARSWLGEDLDRFEQVLESSTAPVKVQLCGPWTWAASVEDGAGRRLLRDEAFVADLADALGLAAADHVREVARRLPGRPVVLQLDEPGLPAILAGAIPTTSGLGRLAAVPAAQAMAALHQVTSAVGGPVVLHCCGGGLFDVARSGGFEGVSWDATVSLDDTIGDDVAETAEAGVGVLPGIVAVDGSDTVDSAWHRLTSLWARTGLGSAAGRRVAVTPACGLAGASPQAARGALATSAAVQARVAAWE